LTQTPPGHNIRPVKKDPGALKHTRGAYQAGVVSNVRLCEDHFKMRLAVEGFPPTRPGQFIQIRCRPPDEQLRPEILTWPDGRLPQARHEELTKRNPLLRRPLSLAGRMDKQCRSVELELIYRTIGSGTRWLAGIKPGEQVSILGPLGNGFTIRKGRPRAVLVGGGVGIPPLLYQACELVRSGINVAAFSGARSAGLVPLSVVPGKTPSREGDPDDSIAEYSAIGVSSAVATDDGSLGCPGLVSDVFKRWIEHAGINPGEIVVYSCGPEAMMRAVGEYCVARGIECQLAMERHMACGMGTCQGCVVKIRSENESRWSYRLCCTDGPVFDARELYWD